MNIKSEFTLDIQGLTIAGVRYGKKDNPVILALHGWLDNAASFELLAEQLTDYCIVAIDLIGHGRSSHRPSSQSYYIWDNITDIHLVLDALKLTKVDLLGHSMGASIAMLFAACFPDKVGKLFLIEGVVPLSYEEENLPEIMSKAITARIEAFTEKSNRTCDIELLVKARMYSRFPVSIQAAQLLVKRGSIRVKDGYIWSSDSSLMLPSIQRMTDDQIFAFLKSLFCKVYIFFGDSGLKTKEWDKYIKCIRYQSTVVISGNHHLHMQSEGSRKIALLISQTYI